MHIHLITEIQNAKKTEHTERKNKKSTNTLGDFNNPLSTDRISKHSISKDVEYLNILPSNFT